MPNDPPDSPAKDEAFEGPCRAWHKLGEALANLCSKPEKPSDAPGGLRLSLGPRQALVEPGTEALYFSKLWSGNASWCAPPRAGQKMNCSYVRFDIELMRKLPG